MLDLQKATTQNKDLVKERDSLAADRKKLVVENKYLGEEICNALISLELPWIILVFTS